MRACGRLKPDGPSWMQETLIRKNKGIDICGIVGVVLRYPNNLSLKFPCDNKMKINKSAKNANHQMLWSAIFSQDVLYRFHNY